MAETLTTRRSVAILDGGHLVRPGAQRARAAKDDLDWLGLGRTLWRRKLFLLGFMVIVLGLTAAYVSRLPPAFEAEALVMLNDRQAQAVPGHRGGAGRRRRRTRTGCRASCC